MKLAILDALTLGDADISVFDRFGETAVYETTAPSELHARIGEAEVLITNKVVIDREAMDAAPALRLICVAATGTNNVDLEYAASRGIAVKNVAGYSTASVAQHTFTLLFALVGHLAYYDAYAKGGEWSRSELFTHLGRSFYEIAGKRWGVIGLGAIGREVARLATCHGCEVAYYSTSGKNTDSTYPQKPLDALLSESDIVSIHAPLNDATQNLIGADELARLRPGAILLNVGRGGIVNEAELARALDERDLYAGLDVLESEPVKQYNPLLFVRRKERLLLTPHIAWSSQEARARLIEGIVKNIEVFLEGAS